MTTERIFVTQSLYLKWLLVVYYTLTVTLAFTPYTRQPLQNIDFVCRSTDCGWRNHWYLQRLQRKRGSQNHRAAIHNVYEELCSIAHWSWKVEGSYSMSITIFNKSLHWKLYHHSTLIKYIEGHTLKIEEI